MNHPDFGSGDDDRLAADLPLPEAESLNDGRLGATNGLDQRLELGVDRPLDCDRGGGLLIAGEGEQAKPKRNEEKFEP
jgi:hypothetical protein